MRFSTVGILRSTLVAALLVGACPAPANEGAASLRTAYSSMGGKLRQNDFGRPIVLESLESKNEVRGEIYALFNHPFATVKSALSGPSRWCDVLMLPINSKTCRTSSEGGAIKLALGIGNKNEQRADSTHNVLFAFRTVSADKDYFASQLVADAGPLGTSNYRILLEAVPVDGGRTFLHLTYSYNYGVAARLAMQAYLGTAGRGKVGFSTAEGSGEKEFVSGMRGVIERNTMRYYLAIEAFLNAIAAPPNEQLDKRLNLWFASTEQYPRQLREMTLAEYLELKRAEHGRLHAAAR